MSSKKKTTKTTPVKKEPFATGGGLLQAIEPVLAEFVEVAKDKIYARWLLASLRKEMISTVKTTPKTVSPQLYNAWAMAPTLAMGVPAEEGGDDDGWIDVEPDDEEEPVAPTPAPMQQQALPTGFGQTMNLIDEQQDLEAIAAAQRRYRDRGGFGPLGGMGDPWF